MEFRTETRFTYLLNTDILIPDFDWETWDLESINEEAGRFKLYPTDNTYTFLLLDVIDRWTYQVQWSQNLEERFVVKIKPGLF